MVSNIRLFDLLFLFVIKGPDQNLIFTDHKLIHLYLVETPINPTQSPQVWDPLVLYLFGVSFSWTLDFQTTSLTTILKLVPLSTYISNHLFKSFISLYLPINVHFISYIDTQTVVLSDHKEIQAPIFLDDPILMLQLSELST